MKKTYLSWRDVEHRVQEILRQIQRDAWQPDYIVGITRGGLPPAVLISQYLGVPMHALQVSLRDGGDNAIESNCWMSEDAYNGKQILIVDDINDSGATLNWICQDWQSSCLPQDTETWERVWNHTTRFATLFDKETSGFDLEVDYKADTILADDDAWIVFPWENWWR